MMNRKKLIAAGISAALALALFSGCGTSATSATQQSSSAATSQAASAAAGQQGNDNRKTASDETAAQVKSVSGNTITALKGELGGGPGNGNGDMKSPPSGGTNGAGASSGNGNGNNPPAQPSGAANGSSGSGSSSAGGNNPPAQPSGNAAPKSGGAGGTPPSGKGGGPGGSTFTAGTDTVTFSISDSTKITVESGKNGTKDGTVSDITAGSVITYTLGDDNVAKTVTVKSIDTSSGSGSASGASASASSSASAAA